MISERISDDIPPQMKILNMVIPILMHFCSLISNWSVASRIKPQGDVIDNIKLFPTAYRRIYCRKFLTLSNQTSRYKRKCIRIFFLCIWDTDSKKSFNFLLNPNCILVVL